MVNQVNDAFTDLRIAVNIRAIPENEISNKAINIVEKILYFNKKRKPK